MALSTYKKPWTLHGTSVNVDRANDFPAILSGVIGQVRVVATMVVQSC